MNVQKSPEISKIILKSNRIKKVYIPAIFNFVKIDSIVEWFIEKVNNVYHGKVGVVFNIVDDRIEWIQKIYDPTEKPVIRV